MSLNIGYCVKCKSKKEFKNGLVKTNSKGVRYVQGNCETCGTKINRFLKKESKIEPIGESENKEVNEVKKVKKAKKIKNDCNC